MIAVDSITEQELDRRFDILSSKLRETLTSERSLSIVNQICQKNNITEEEKIIIIHQIVGLVILGLIHSYDLGAEINETLSLNNPKFANAIAEELNAKVFLPIKAELENNYHPVTPTSLEQKNTPSKNLIANSSLSKESPTVAASSPITTTSLAPKVVAKQPTPAILSSTAPAPKPTTLSDVGWSKSSPTGPGIKLTPFPSAPAVPQAVPVPPKAPPAAPAEPAPMILHEDTTFKAAEKNAGFTLSKPGSGAEVHMSQGATQAPTRPAVLEFGGVKAPAAPNKPAATPSSSAVHYTELKLSLSAVPTADTGPRSVSQIGAVVPIPTPPKPPTPTPNVVPVPRPPQKDKPIVKDFL